MAESQYQCSAAGCAERLEHPGFCASHAWSRLALTQKARRLLDGQANDDGQPRERRCPMVAARSRS